MTSAFSAITAALVATLGATPAVSTNIFRARARQLAEEHADAINVQFDSSVPQAGAIHGAPVDWVSTFTVECFARSVAMSGDLAVDPIVLAVYNRIMADTTLGGLVTDINPPSIEAEYATAGEKTGWMNMTFQILHRTSSLTLE